MRVVLETRYVFRQALRAWIFFPLPAHGFRRPDLPKPVFQNSGRAF